jgi:hypothetical protein
MAKTLVLIENRRDLPEDMGGSPPNARGAFPRGYLGKEEAQITDFLLFPNILERMSHWPM